MDPELRPNFMMNKNTNKITVYATTFLEENCLLG